MRIKILKAGLLATMQDLGRWDYLSVAIPTSGAVDSLSARLANLAVGNSENSAVIEFTYADAQFESLEDGVIAYSGEGAVLYAADQKLPSNCPVFIPQGKVIRLVNSDSGSRTYLAVAGGWKVDLILNSKSTYLPAGFGGLAGKALRNGDVLVSDETSPLNDQIILSLTGKGISFSSWRIFKRILQPLNKNKIRIIPGPEFTWFDGRSIMSLLTHAFSVGMKSNRMGIQIEGPTLNRYQKQELLSTAVCPGTIQVTSGGSLILLLADCQTTGGYPRIAQVTAVDLPLCAQLKPGNRIEFEEISLENAELLYIEQEKSIQQIKTAISSRF